jgi:uncharacterized protein YqcC (DUF446 family)
MTSPALDKLDEIEAEMKHIGYWSDALELQAETCTGRFGSCLDAPSFRIWVQTLFLPNARAVALEGNLPARSQAGEIVRRQYADDASAPEARRLRTLIHEFDELCLMASRDETGGQTGA